ncbi:hypothetical protein J437_LFUL009677 [Ladona fulva]|uniref:NADH dehydrogenase [ubiquinone] 1 beta subcomplex subunit 8, mitochondrial n=1 Tax=Ladona fulva TaxID=123851 RepID=A0A8K0NY49_LADFU|nr:hypothetical protein J437_LFUL009677 [Ladona fulva]
MAAVARVLCSKKAPRFHGLFSYQIVRNYWNKDWKPGPYPQTAEEREAAAKKYGLLPREYQPYPDDGMGYGDYPKLPINSADSRDPYHPWDMPDMKKNYGELMHSNANIYGEDRYDASSTVHPPEWKQWTAFFVVVGGFTLAYHWLDDKKMFRPVMVKDLPNDGRKHYTFEPAS